MATRSIECRLHKITPVVKPSTIALVVPTRAISRTDVGYFPTPGRAVTRVSIAAPTYNPQQA